MEILYFFLQQSVIILHSDCRWIWNLLFVFMTIHYALETDETIVIICRYV